MPTYPIASKTAPLSPNSGKGDHLLAGIKNLLAFPATFPLSIDKAGEDIAYGISGQHPPGTSQVNDMLDIIDQWVHKESGPPQTYTDQAAELAPALATAPGLLGKVMVAAPTVVSDAVNSPKFMAGLAQAGAAEAGVPYVTTPTASAAAPTASPNTASITTDNTPQYTPVFNAPVPVEKPSVVPSGQGSLSTVPQEACYEPQFTAPQYQSTLGPPALTPFDKPSDVERTDAATGTAPYDDSKDTYSRTAAVLGGVVALGLVAAGVKYAKGARDTEGALSGRMTDAPVPGSDVIPDPNVSFANPQAGSLGTNVVTQLVDKQAPLRDLLNNLPDGPQKDNLVGRVSLSDAHGIDLATNDFYNTARLPGSGIKLKEPPINVFKDISSLSEVDRKEINDLVTLNTRLDQSRANNYAPWGTGTNKLDFNDMLAQHSAITANRPDLLKLADRYHAMFADIPRYAEQMGAIDAGTRAKLEATNPYFAPQHRQYVGHWYDNLFSDSGVPNKSSTSFLDFQKRMDITTEGLNPGESGDLLLNANDYFDNLFKAVTYNKYRSDVVSAFNGVAVNGKPAFTLVNELPKDPGTYGVPVYINGQKQFAIPQNYGVYSALMFRPRTGVRALSQINQAVQWSLTGPGNPLFPFTKALTFDTLHAPLMLPKGTDTSPLAAFPLTGILRGLWKDTAQASAHYFQQAATNNTWLANALGPKNVETFGKLLQDVTERSTASLAEKYGALGGSRYQVIGVGRNIPEALAQNIPEFRNFSSSYSSTPGYNIIHSIMHASREGARLQFLASNLERQLVVRSYPFEFGQGANKKTYNLKMLGWELPEDYDPTKLMAQTRRLMGDSTEIGGDTTTTVGRAYQKTLSGVMFGNQTIQVSAQIARMIKDHPVRFAATASAMTYGAIHAYQMMLDDPSTRQMVQDMTPEQRGRIIPVKLPGWDQPMMLSNFQEMRPFVAGAIHMYLGLTGQLPKGDFESPWDAGKVAWNVTKDDYLPNFMGLASLAAPLFGKRIPPNSMNAGDAPSSQVGESNDPDYKNSAEATIHNILDASTGPVIHAIGSGIIGLHQTLAQNGAVKSKEFKLSPQDMTRITAQQVLGPLRDDKTLGPLAPLWGIGSKMSVGNVTNEKVRDIRQALPQIIQLGADTVKSGGNRLQAGSPSPQGMSGIVPNSAGTPFALVYQGALQLDKTLKPLQMQYRQYLNEEDKINALPTYADPKDKMTLLNELARKKAELNNEMLTATRAKEAELSKSIPGFNFNNWQATIPH